MHIIYENDNIGQINENYCVILIYIKAYNFVTNFIDKILLVIQN